VPTNRIEIEWKPSQGLEAKLWDKGGGKHDITAIIQMLTGSTGVGKIYTQIELGNGVVNTIVGFKPLSEEIKLDVPESVTRQLLELLG